MSHHHVIREHRDRHENHSANLTAVFFTRFLLPTAILCFVMTAAVRAQTSDSQAANENRSWVTTSESQTNGATPTRTTTRHTQSNGRTLDDESVQVRGPNGDFQPYQDTETETVQLDANTVRTTTRAFTWDANGSKTLVQVKEEETRKLPGGEWDTTRSVSNADANGNLQVVQREIEHTKKLGSDADETKTTLMLPSVNGGLSPAREVQETRRHTAKDIIDTQRTTLLPDGAGNWQVDEVRDTTTKQDGKASSTVERVSRPDERGKLAEVSRTVSNESQEVSGEKRRVTENYSLDVPGSSRDGSLHLVERQTTRQPAAGSGEQTVEQTIERPTPGDPSSGLRVTSVRTDVLRSGPSGGVDTRTLDLRDANGNLNVVSVDTTKSDNAHAIQVQIAPSPKH